MKIRYVHGDITKQDPKYVIAHCISKDCAMGAGVVVAINKLHPNVKTACIEHVRAFKKTVGTTYRFEDSHGVVYNMFTKDYYYETVESLGDYAYYNNLEKCLASLHRQMRDNNEKHLAMPVICCGLDKGDWADVSYLINKEFEKSDIEVVVVQYGN